MSGSGSGRVNDSVCICGGALIPNRKTWRVS